MEAVFLSFLNRGIAASYLVVAILLLRLVLRKAPKALRCILWSLVAVRLVCPISLESSLSLIPSAEPLPPDIIYTATPAIESGIDSIDGIVNPILSANLTTDQLTSANPTQIWSFLLSRLWLLGAAVLLLYAVFSYLRLHRQVRASIPLRDNLMLCDQVQSPFILGLVRPKIYLPSSLEQEPLSHIIAHENAHLARHDHWWKPLGYVLLSVYWFNPLLWAAYILLCRDIELACDERVIRHMELPDKKAYSATLLSCSIRKHPLAACPLAFGEVGIKQRVQSVLHYKKPAFWVVLLGIGACIGAAVCFLTNPAPAEPQATMKATVREVASNSYLVVPMEDPQSLIWVTAQNVESSLEPMVGDLLEITYDGQIMETYPGQINNPYHIRVISRPDPILPTSAQPVEPQEQIARLFDSIESSPAESSAPGDYLNAHPEEVQELLDYGTDTLQYVILQFLRGNQTGLEGHLLWYFLNQLAPDEQLKCTAQTGQEYFDLWFAYARTIADLNSREFMEEYMPASTLALDLAGEYPSAE